MEKEAEPRMGTDDTDVEKRRRTRLVFAWIHLASAVVYFIGAIVAVWFRFHFTACVCLGMTIWFRRTAFELSSGNSVGATERRKEEG